MRSHSRLGAKRVIRSVAHNAGHNRMALAAFGCAVEAVFLNYLTALDGTACEESTGMDCCSSHASGETGQVVTAEDH